MMASTIHQDVIYALYVKENKIPAITILGS